MSNNQEQTWKNLFAKAGTPPATSWVVGPPTSIGDFDVLKRTSRLPDVEKDHNNRSVAVEGSIPGYTGHIPSLYVDPLFPPTTKENAIPNSIPGYTGHIPGIMPENVLGATFEQSKGLANEVLATREATRRYYETQAL